MPRTISCRVCGKSVRGTFAVRMQKLRTHYRNVHPQKWRGWEHLKPRRGGNPMAPDPRRRRYYGRRRRSPVRWRTRYYGRPIRRFGRRGRRGFMRMGRGLTLKSVLGAIVGLWGMKKVIGVNSMTGFSLGNYDPPIQKIAAGAILQGVGLDNMDLVSAGIKEAAATAIDDLTARFLGGGGVGVGGGL